MSYHRLVLATLTRHRSQILITTLSILVAFFLFGLMMSLRAALTGGSAAASAYRLRSQGASSFMALLPLAYAGRIARVPGIDYVGYVYAAPAAYQDDPAHLLLQAASVTHFFDLLPELRVTAAVQRQYLNEKTALLAGPDAMKRYGWKVGQDVSLRTNIPNAHGTGDWRFHVVGVYDSNDPSFQRDLTFVHYDYLNDGRADRRDQVMVYTMHISAVAEAQVIAAHVDAAFATASPRLRTQPESLAIQRQMGEFSGFVAATLYVAIAVLISVLLLTLNVFFQRNRYRRREWATLRALGFGRHHVLGLIVAECGVVVFVGAAGGVALGGAATRALRPAVSGILAGFHFPSVVLWVAVLIAAAYTLIVALIPAWLATRGNIAESLRASR